ncbi:Putative abortive phage resistance protein AbiGi, antitoxin [Chitinophaga sp. CF118]|nr:Putative abortive phage resistance protein AbiGi, antitoxin [Chitinophaga sp. CF118]
MAIHSNILVHWTCKEENTTSEQYVTRLKSTIFQGLYLNKGSERIVGHNNTAIKADISRVCLTEIRLTQVTKHTSLYGKLGIGFSRDFVIRNFGNPVSYVTNSNAYSLLVEHFDHLHGFLANHHYEEYLARLQYIMGFVKNMSDVNENDMKYYEEMEWRIVHNKLMEIDGRILPEDPAKSIYRLVYAPREVKLIVFPNEETNALALSDPDLLRFFKDHTPILLTLEDCNQF